MPISRNGAYPRRTVLSGFGISLLGGWSNVGNARSAAIAPGRFGFTGPETPEGFTLDGKVIQLRSGELHPARIPVEYWSHRIRMAKAMGLNTIAIYVMWNHHEAEQGKFDFTSGNRDIAAFIRLCAAEGLFVYLRPGPYVCAEWDLGGLPAWLLKTPGIRLRHREDATYMAASERYIDRIATLVRPLMIDRGGPIVMVQVENEYASFGTDLDYLKAVRKMWTDRGFDGPFAIADGLGQIRKAQTYLPGAALGLDGGENFVEAQKIAGTAPVWVGEGYPGWLTHWGEPKFARNDYRKTLAKLMADRRSFNLYVVHGGTNFGFTAGANAAGDGSKYEPSITAYDYGAPINECGLPNSHYRDFRQTIAAATGKPALPIPPAIPRTDFPEVRTRPRGSIWTALPPAVDAVSPGPMELVLGQTQGMVLYRRDLAPGDAGELRIDGLHDEALVLIDGKTLGSLSRVAAARAPASLMVPAGTAKTRRLDILVFAYGRVNFGRYMEDRKGILGAVSLAGKPLENWAIHGLPLDDRHLAAVRAAPTKPGGLVHEATFMLVRTGDTFIDMAAWKLGFTWVNGHLLGRHCGLGPQTRLYCPASWLWKGSNTVTILDLYAPAGLSVRGVRQSDLMVQDDIA